MSPLPISTLAIADTSASCVCTRLTPSSLPTMVTFTGVECHNEWEITFEEIHRNNAIAYAIYAPQNAQ